MTCDGFGGNCNGHDVRSCSYSKKGVRRVADLCSGCREQAVSMRYVVILMDVESSGVYPAVNG